MPNRKSHNTSAVPGKARKDNEDEKASNVRRQEGTVEEHRERVNRNQSATDAEEKQSVRHREPERR